MLQLFTIVLVWCVSLDQFSSLVKYGVGISGTINSNRNPVIRLYQTDDITDSFTGNAADSSSIRKQSMQELATNALIGSVFKIRPLFLLARNKARNSMVERGDKLGISWSDNIAKYKMSMGDLQDRFDRLSDSLISYPDYYLKPFHAYDEGNLSWQVTDMCYPLYVSILQTVLSDE